jgi:SAM-dependent methyltransferase
MVGWLNNTFQAPPALAGRHDSQPFSFSDDRSPGVEALRSENAAPGSSLSDPPPKPIDNRPQAGSLPQMVRHCGMMFAFLFNGMNSAVCGLPLAGVIEEPVRSGEGDRSHTGALDFLQNDSLMVLSDTASNVEPGAEGIWFSRNRSAVSYPEHGNDICFEIEDGSFWFRHRNSCLLEAMRRFPPNGVFFDIGGGNGYVALAIQDAGWPVVLVEPGERGARNARRRGLTHVVCSTFEDAGFVERGMPAAGAFDVVEHVADDVAFLQSIGRTLAPGGRLYLTVPAFQSLWSQEDDDAGHYRRYTVSSLRRTIERAGLEVEYATYFFSFLPLPILIMRSLPYRIGIRLAPAELERARAQHRSPRGSGPLLKRLTDRELTVIRSGRTLRFGGSCLAIAKAR